MENYLLAAALATVAPGLLIKGCTALIGASWNVTSRMVYGKQRTEQEITLQEVKQLKKDFEEKMAEIKDREQKIDLKLDQILKLNYSPKDEPKDEPKDNDTETKKDN